MIGDTMGQVAVYFCITSRWEEAQPSDALMSELDSLELDLVGGALTE